MQALRMATLAGVLLLSIGIGFVACTQEQSGLPAPHGNAQAQPKPIATQLLPGPVPSSEAIPSPVATGQAIATEQADALAKAPTVAAARAATATAFAAPVMQRDYGSWSFIVIRNPRTIDYRPSWELIANTQYDDTTVETLKAYARDNQELIQRLADEEGSRQIEVFITLRNYVSPERFNRWASDVGIRPAYTDIRVLYDKDPLYTPVPQIRLHDAERIAGDRLRVSSTPGDSEPLTTSRVAEALAAQERDYSQIGYKLHELKGVYFISATVEARHLPRIANDPSVFIADVSYEWIRHELRASGVEGADEVRVLSVNGASSPDTFQHMERIGLDKFAP